MFIFFLFVVAFLKVSHGYFGITRSSLYEENESTWIAWTNEEIPPNLQQFFKFDGKILLVIPPNGLSIEFVIARPEIENDNFIAEWCAPTEEEYEKCEYDALFVCNTYINKTRKGVPFNLEICNLGLTSMAFIRFNKITALIRSMQDIKVNRYPPDISKLSKCYRIAIYKSDGEEFNGVETLDYNKWTTQQFVGESPVGGLKNIPLPGHSGYKQSGRMLNGKFCDIPFRFPDTGVVFQKGIRKIDNVFEVLEGPSSQILLDQPDSNLTIADIASTTTTILPSSHSSINYLIAIIFGGICGGIICIAFICLIGTLVIRKKRKETFDGQPSFSLEPIYNKNDDFGIANPPIIQSIEAGEAPPSSISKIESVQNDYGYSKLMKADFENSGQVLPLHIFDKKNQSIIQFLTQQFESSTPIKGSKFVDELLQEALEEPMAENRAEKLLHVVIKANNELYSLGYRNKQFGDSSKFHLSTPPNSDALLKTLKGGNFMRFIISVCEKDIDGKNGEFEDDPKRWKKYVEEVDVGECFRHACLFGQTMKRRQFFVLASFYKISLLISENPNQKDLLSMKYPIPFFIILWQKYPHYFEIQ